MRASRTFAIAASLAAIGGGMLAPLAHRAMTERLGRDGAYDAGAVLMFLAAAAVPIFWPPAAATSSISRNLRYACLAAGTVTAFAVLYRLSLSWLPAVFAGPLDVNRGDMLVVTEAGIRRVLDGKTPYAMYHVPWEMTLSYGPMLWGPFVLPVVLRVDMRVLTLICFGVVVFTLVLTGARAAANRDGAGAAALLLLVAILAAHPSLYSYFPTAHTMVYWPLLVIFCALLSADRWIAAAVALGLLVCARTTMVALVPVFLMAAYVQRQLNWRLAVALAAAGIGPFLPFIIADPRSVEFAMYGAYQKTIKGTVWHETSWVQQTFGVTGPLLRHGLSRYVEIVQVVCLIVVYGCAWRSLRRGTRVEPWLAFALFAFSMTTLWPVTYLYFDVWVLMAASLAFRVSPAPRRLTALAGAFTLAFVVAAAATLSAATTLHGTYDLDVGSPASAALTGGGFGADQRAVDGERDFVWVEGPAARVRAPRASRSAATIAIDLRPFEDTASPRQQLRVSVNGRAAGDPIALDPGWQTVSVVAPANRWVYGFNVVTLEFSRLSAEPGTGRQLSAGIDRIRIK